MDGLSNASLIKSGALAGPFRKEEESSYGIPIRDIIPECTPDKFSIQVPSAVQDQPFFSGEDPGAFFEAEEMRV